MNSEVLILGSGPAGLSASIYTARGGLDTLVISHGKSPLLWAGRIENYLGFPDGVNGKDLYEDSIRQAERFGVRFARDEIVALEKTDGGIKLGGITDEYEGKTLLLATGNPPKKIMLKNLERFEGNGVAYCAACDGFFYKGLKTGVLGYRDYAVREAQELLDYTDDITIYTNGRELAASGRYAELAKRFRIVKKKIAGLEGRDSLEKIGFEDGSEESTAGLFIASGSASSLDFAVKTGILTEDGLIVVDDCQKTNIDGIFAAGACTSLCRSANQIATSVGQGALAGKKMLEHLGKSSADHFNAAR